MAAIPKNDSKISYLDLGQVHRHNESSQSIPDEIHACRTSLFRHKHRQLALSKYLSSTCGDVVSPTIAWWQSSDLSGQSQAQDSCSSTSTWPHTESWLPWGNLQKNKTGLRPGCNAKMECYATPWRLWILYFLQSPPIPRISPLSLFVGIFFSFCPFNHGLARSQVH